MGNVHIAPYGSWKSPITSEMLVSQSIRLGAPAFDGDDLYWVEGRPKEGGRSVIVRRMQNGDRVDVTPAGFNVRTRAHEYGGGAYTVSGGTVYFSNFADNQVYQQKPGEPPAALTTHSEQRFADFILDTRRNRLIAVCEDHTDSDSEPENYLAAIDFDTGHVEKLASGCDFYSSPRLSPDGQTLAWLCWNHPNMPWDATELHVARVAADGSLETAAHVAGGNEESIFQPDWSPSGALYFVSDRSNWWNLYRFAGDIKAGGEEAVYPMDAEFGLPQWVFGMTTYGFLADGRIICTYTSEGDWHLALLDPTRKQLTPLDLPFSAFDSLAVSGTKAAFIGGSPTKPGGLVVYDANDKRTETIQLASSATIEEGYISVPESISFPTEGELTAFAYYYPAMNKDFTGPDGELPPLLVMSHGGPTGATEPTFSLRIQYFTSRGIAVLDVNYGGSTGYGRTYRQRLNGNWGIVDIDDCTNGALYLAKQGKVDGHRLLIEGGSAGGYTTLAALTFRNVFRAGASFFGVSDIELLAKDTHKFESRYMDSLVGPYPESQSVYRARSPLYHTDELNCPVIFLQGLDDKIVPPNQAELMVDALRQRNIPVAYIAFEGEGHGFRQAANIQRSIEAELYFFGRILGFEVADDIEPVEILNLS